MIKCFSDGCELDATEKYVGQRYTSHFCKTHYDIWMKDSDKIELKTEVYRERLSSPTALQVNWY